MKLHQELYHEIYHFLSRYTHWDWDENFYTLFRSCVRSGEDDLAIKVYWKLVEACKKTQNAWVFKEIKDDYPDCVATLKRYNLWTDTLSLIDDVDSRPKVYENKETRRSRYDYCLCCYRYVVGRSDIEDALEQATETSLHSIIDRALGERDFYKRWFLVYRILFYFSEMKLEQNLIIDLWYKAEKAGVRFDPVFFDFPPSLYYESEFKEICLRIFNYTHKEHDGVLDDIIDELIAQSRYNEALYWLKKLSRPTTAIWSAHTSLLMKPEISIESLSFLRKVHQVHGARLRPSS
jgi:hypothetical protein